MSLIEHHAAKHRDSEKQRGEPHHRPRLHHPGGRDPRRSEPALGVRAFAGVDRVVEKIRCNLDRHRAAERAKREQEIERAAEFPSEHAARPYRDDGGGQGLRTRREDAGFEGGSGHGRSEARTARRIDIISRFALSRFTRLDGGDGDVLYQRAARQVVARAIEPLEHGADADDVDAALDCLVGGVASVG